MKIRVSFFGIYFSLEGGVWVRAGRDNCGAGSVYRGTRNVWNITPLVSYNKNKHPFEGGGGTGGGEARKENSSPEFFIRAIRFLGLYRVYCYRHLFCIYIVFIGMILFLGVDYYYYYYYYYY